jgi:hypothetical protein
MGLAGRIGRVLALPLVGVVILAGWVYRWWRPGNRNGLP